MPSEERSAAISTPARRKRRAAASSSNYLGVLPFQLSCLAQCNDVRRRGCMRPGPSLRGDCAAPEVVEDEQPDCRGQIALLAVCVDLANQLGQRHVACAGDLFHAGPERLFEADAGLVAGNYDRSLDDA